MDRSQNALRDFIQNNEGNIAQLRQLRHRAVHECNPPQNDDCEKARQLIHKLLKCVFNLDKIDYPFQPKYLGKIAELIPELV